jgi:FlaA1/EpsC-like NDP-sugar epimerase
MYFCRLRNGKMRIAFRRRRKRALSHLMNRSVSVFMPHGTFDAFSFAAAFVLLIVLFLLKNLLKRLIFRFARRHGNVGRRAIVIGNSADGARAFIREAEYAARRGAASKVDNRSRITVLGTVGDFPDGLGCPNLGGVDRLCEILETLSPDYAVFAIESYEKDRLIRLVNLCDDKCVKVYFLPVIYGYLKSEKQVEIFGTTPLINIHTTPLDVPIYAFLKRTFDIFGSAVLIILTSPIMLFCAFGVKLTSRGSVLFR